MGRAVIHINEKGLDGMIDALRQVATPSFLVTGRLEEALDQVGGIAQDRVHIISGRLQASYRKESDFDGDTWTGELMWGGDEYIPDGYDTPAYYAIFEQARSSEHDWLSGLESHEKLFEAAIDFHFKVMSR